MSQTDQEQIREGKTLEKTKKNTNTEQWPLRPHIPDAWN